MNPYESEEILGEYLLFHYGTEEEILGGLPGPREALDFPVRCVRDLLAPVPPRARALDLGCAVGRSSLELANHCARVVGFDFSRAFIGAARALASGQSVTIQIREEGERRHAFTVAGRPNPRIAFDVGDAANLPADLGEFEVVLAANLLCRLREPRKFLTRVPSLVAPGGQLLLTTPFTWLEEFTPRANWLGGRAGERSFDALSEALAPHFTLEATTNLPFLIREHARKFQYGVALGSRWRRKP